MSRKIRPIVVDGDIAFVTLTKGYVAIIDAEDVHRVEGRNWCALTSNRRKAVYAARVDTVNYKQTMVLMHRLLSGAPASLLVDHCDGDGLNNRKINLRHCTYAENSMNVGLRSDNKSGFKGVFFDGGTRKWRSEIQARGQSTHLGLFPTPEEAHSAYTVASLELHGVFGRHQ